MRQEPGMYSVLPVKGKTRPGTEELHEVWQTFEDNPKFFECLEMAEDGGFTEISCLFTLDRFFWAPLQILSLLMNAVLVVGWNIQILSEIPVSMWVADTSTGIQRWLLINQFFGLFVSSGQRVNHDVVLVFLELIMFTYYSAKAARAGIRICMYSGAPRWRAVASLFWDLIPELSVVSAMKSLNYVTPSVLTRDLTLKVMRVFDKESTYKADCLALLWLVLGRCLHFLIGFEAFMIKFSNTASNVRLATDEFSALLASAAFLNQVLGIINVQKFSQQRLFLFIFGGEDGFLSQHEEQVAITWLGMLAQRMWKSASQRTPRCAWFLSLALTYNDQDFQKLILNEEAKKKSRRSSDASAEAEVIGTKVA